MLSRKYYRAIAQAISNNTSIRDRDRIVKSKLINSLVVLFGNDNPRFDATRFKEACRI